MEEADPLTNTTAYTATAPMALYEASSAQSNGTQYKRFWYGAPLQRLPLSTAPCLPSLP
jgi:hypothetical protein